MKPTKLLKILEIIEDAQAKPKPKVPEVISKKTKKPMEYAERHRGSWFKPEYDPFEILIVEDTESMVMQAIKKKTDRLLTAKWEIVGQSEAAVKYVKKRIAEIEYVSRKPFNILIKETAADIFKFRNCMWAKVRDRKASTGRMRTTKAGVRIEPVAGYFIIPFETIRFDVHKNGEIRKVRQLVSTGKYKDWSVKDVVFFYDSKKPGYTMGTPDLTPAIEDIRLLRIIEENVEDLIESNLYPMFHYKIGSDNFPERAGPDGVRETQRVRQTVNYMPPGGVYISDHRHQIEAIGSEGRALRIESYLDYFKKRVIGGIGMSSVDFGDGDTSGASANVLSQGATQDVEAVQETLKTFIEFFVFSELLLEGGFNPLKIENRVEIRFGIVDRESRTKLENQIIQLFLNNLIDETEARTKLGFPPEFNRGKTTHMLYTEPLAKLGKAKGDEKSSNASKGASKTSSSRSRPSNQHGTRSSPKLKKDSLLSIWQDCVSQVNAIFDEALDNHRGNTIKYRKIELAKNSILLEYNNVTKQILDKCKLDDELDERARSQFHTMSLRYLIVSTDLLSDMEI